MLVKLDYYYGNEAEQYSFYRIPKALFTDEHYLTLSLEAKVLYGLMLDRMALSVRNSWMEKDGRVFIYFTLEEATAMLQCGHTKGVRLFAELEKLGLIERRKQGQGRPAKIYVKNFIPQRATEQTPETQNSPQEKGTPHKTESLPFPKPDANKTDKNQTDRSETDPSIPLPPSDPVGGQRAYAKMDEMDGYRALIQDNIRYDLLLQEHPCDQDLIDSYVELMAETCCTGKPYLRVGGQELPASVVRSRFLKLNHDHIAYVLERMQRSTSDIANIRAYLLAALYNAPTTICQYYASQASHDLAAVA